MDNRETHNVAKKTQVDSDCPIVLVITKTATAQLDKPIEIANDCNLLLTIITPYI